MSLDLKLTEDITEPEDIESTIIFELEDTKH